MKLLKRSLTGKYDYYQSDIGLVLVRCDYNTSQPRDARGRWTSGGGARGAGGSSGSRARSEAGAASPLSRKKLTELQALAAELGADPPARYKNRKSSWIEQIKKAKGGGNQKPAESQPKTGLGKYTAEQLGRKKLTQLQAIASELGADPPARYKNRKSSWIEQIQKVKGDKKQESAKSVKPKFTAARDVKQSHIDEWNKAYEEAKRFTDLIDHIIRVDDAKETHRRLNAELEKLKAVAPERLNELNISKEALIAGRQKQIKEAEQDIKKAQTRLEQEKASIGKSPYKDLTEEQLYRVSSSEWVFDAAVSDKNRVAVLDQNGRMQSAFSWSNHNDAVHVEFLATAPWNIGGTDPRKTRGGGTHAIAEAVKLSIEKGHGGKVDLFALDDAVPFYESIGFVNDGMNNMVLESGKGKKLLKRLGYSK